MSFARALGFISVAFVQACSQFSVTSGEGGAASDSAGASDGAQDAADGGANADGPFAWPGDGGAPGNVTVSVSNAAGWGGKIFMVRVFPRGMSFGNRLAGACAEVSADPWSYNGTLIKPLSNSPDPCAFETGAAVLNGGSYDLALTITPKGNIKPDMCGSVPLVVDGDTKVTVKPSDLKACF